MIQTKKKPVVAAAAAVAPSTQTPYTAARSGKDTTVNRAEADGSAQALDRRVTEGFNLVHGRLDVIQEDVRENRRDIKELRKELWDGLREAAADRARLASKADLDRRRKCGRRSPQSGERSGRRPGATGVQGRPRPTPRKCGRRSPQSGERSGRRSPQSGERRPPTGRDWRPRPTSTNSARVQPPIAGELRASSTPRLPRFGRK